MSQTKFEKAVSIVQGLPKDGPIKPTQDEQLYVGLTLSLLTANWVPNRGIAQFYSYYKQGKRSMA